MALNSINKEALSFKKLFGKAHTQFSFGIVNEVIPSNIQIASSTVFADQINPLPATNAGLTALGDTDGIVEKVRFEIDILPDTTIGTNQSQGYALKLPVGYNGVLSADYSGNTLLYEALGRLQIVPKLYGTLKPDATTEYDPVLFQTDGNTIISTLSEINWNLDPYNGILFVQNPPAGYDISNERPAFIEAYLYVGDYLNESGGNGERIQKTITKNLHGFVAGDIISTSGGTYIKSLSVAGQPEVLGIVSQVNNINEFVVVYAGFTDKLGTMTDEDGLPISGDTVYYVSDTNAGKLATNEPSSVDDISRPILYAIDGNSGNVLPYRGNLITSGGTGGGTSNVTLNNLGNGEEVGISVVNGSEIQLKTLVGSGNTSVTTVDDEIIINTTGVTSVRTVIQSTANNVIIPNSTNDVFYVAFGTTNFTLPNTPKTGAVITIADGQGDALTNNITINGNGKQIVGFNEAIIDTNYGSITFEYNGVFWSVTRSAS